MTKKPTAKEQKAIDHYIVHRNKSDAYRHAYSSDNMKPQTINRNAILVFNRPRVKQIVDTAIKKVSEDAGIDAAWVLKRASLLANFNIRKFIVVENGTAYYDFSQATDDDWYCISEYTVDEIGTGANGKFLVDRVKIKTHDKIAALKLVGTHIDVQAFRENHAIGGSHDMPPIQTAATLTEAQALAILAKNKVK